MRTRRAIPLALAALAYLLALVQRPGEVVADTKVHLFLDPGRFLRDVVSLWSSAPDLGHVWASQYGGYVWPMAPWFALGDAVGLPAWLVHRLWLGTLLALAAWGVVRMLDALATRERGALHVAAGALYVVNPYVTVYADRASVTLLAYAALPWLLLCVHAGLRDPRGWRWPALFALVLATAGGGVNAASTAWILVGPLLLMIYDRVWGGVGAGALRPFLLRLAPVAIVANIWWLVPLLLAGRGAPNFLVFTEQPGTIWSTTTLPESLRLMGFWTSYVGVGYGGLLRPYQGSAPALLLLQPVVVAGLLVPAFAVAGFPWTRRWRYAPFFLLMTLVGVVIMVAGWPDGTPLRRLATGAYYRIETLQPLRTTYKAGALVALGVAVLAGAAFAEAWGRWRRPLLAVAAAALAALAAWPLVTGRALERQLQFDLPRHWRDVAADLDRRPDGTRAMVLPGQLFASYRWGGTVDAVLPALTDHPVTTRWIIPFADLRSTELQFAVDALVTQERLRPGELRPLLALLGVGDVLVAADGDRSRSGEMPPADAARLLAAQGLDGGRAYGPALTAQPAAGRVEPERRVPSLRRVELPSGGLVQVLPRDPLTVVDGAAGGLTALAAFGDLDPARAYRYAPDVGAGEMRRAAAAGASFVIADGNRRRAFVAARAKGQTGPTLARDEGVSVDGTILDPFGGLDQRAQTVAELRGVRSVTAPASPQVTQFPDRRPFAALDGDEATAWIADRQLVPSRHVLSVDLGRPRDLGAVRLLPYSDSRAVVQAVEVNGRRFDVRRGWNTLPVGLRGVRHLDVRIAKVSEPVDAPGGAGGIRELRIPGVRATERLRPPTVVEDALRGADVSADSITYLLDRTTADVPSAQQRYVGERGAGELRDAQDPELALRRVVRPPAARTFDAEAWATVDPRLSDDALDTLAAGGAAAAGARAAARSPASFTSSSRLEGLPRYRASGAFDGSRSRAWIGQWVAGRPAWLGWKARAPRTIRRLVLVPARAVVRAPTRVRLVVDDRPGPELAVRGGVVSLPAPVRGRDFRLEILDARFPAGTPARIKQRRAVGIGELRGTGVRARPVPASGRVDLPCGTASVRAGAQVVKLAGSADRAALDAGTPIRLHACSPARLPAHDVTLDGSRFPLRVDGLRLHSAAPTPRLQPAGGGRVLDDGRENHGGREGVRLAVRGPSYLVLGQSYDTGWRATCDGRDLGKPVPLQGYANGWSVDRGCRAASFSYKPQRLADAAYWIGGVAGLALLAFLLATTALGRSALAMRGSGAPELGEREVASSEREAAPSVGRSALASRGSGAPELAGGGQAAVRPLPVVHALAVALPVAAAVGVGFGLRAGAVAAPLLALVLWRGVSDRALTLAAAGVLGIAVPLIYVGVAIFGGEHVLGGNSTQYGSDRVAAHWLAVGAFVALAVVLWRTLAAARAADRAAPPIASRR